MHTIPLGSATIPPTPGCDCFGCCTVCEPGTNTCYDIAINPTTSPNCTANTISDPAACLRCTKNTVCEGPTCGTSCVLCPGENPNDLDPSCNGTSTCPSGIPTCPTGSGCPAQTHCASGCCIGVIQ